MHFLNPRTELDGQQAGIVNKQNMRLLIALSLLLVALVFVLARDRDFWFGSDQTAESEGSGSEEVANSAGPAKTGKTTRNALAKNHLAGKSSAKPAVTLPSDKATTETVSPVITTNRVALPPLDVEVVAGDTHRTVHPGSNAAKVEIPNNSTRSGITAMASLPASAAERELLSTTTAPELRQSGDSSYPLLGQHTRVQGSVVLQAVVGADGIIENLSVISGPSILATAAQQAVRQWRFKPYLQNGQPVETKTRITVNFSIRVGDNPTANS